MRHTGASSKKWTSRWSPLPSLLTLHVGANAGRDDVCEIGISINGLASGHGEGYVRLMLLLVISTASNAIDH
jgi:hypothetical protein